MTKASGLRFHKGEPRCLTKKRQQKFEAKDERTCRTATKIRDLGKCRIPGCRERGTELHHIVTRRVKKSKWLTSNCVWLCTDHHRLRHAGVIQISGDADKELIVTGDTELLKFRL